MDHRRMNDTIYVRIDRGEEIIAKLTEICRMENVRSAVFTGIGGCSHAEIQTFIPEKGTFETESVDGMLELINITGNFVEDGGKLFHHTHAMFSFKDGNEHKTAAGHLKAATVLYTAEIELRPTSGGVIKRKHDPETGTGFWDFG
ncbi:MAG: DUF296 domain-containing protein [Clostridia bacterium]|nr:DUF296 domain-containing protein [Clostridia bacterium]